MDDIRNTPEASTPPLHSFNEVDAHPDSRAGRSPVEAIADMRITSDLTAYSIRVPAGVNGWHGGPAFIK